MAKVFNFNNPQEVTSQQKQFIEKLSGLEEYFINFLGQEYADVIKEKLDEVLCVFVSKGHFEINLIQYKQYFEKVLLDKFCASVKISNNFKDVDDLLYVIKSTLSAENSTELNDEIFNALFDDFGYSKMFKNKTEFLEYLKNQENFDNVKNRAFLLNEDFRLQYLPIVETIKAYNYDTSNVTSRNAQKSLLEHTFSNNFLTFDEELIINILNESNFFNAQFNKLELYEIKNLFKQDLDNLEDELVIVNSDAILTLFKNDDLVKDKINKDMTPDELLSDNHIKSKLKAFQSYYKTIKSIADSTISEVESVYNISNNNMAELARVIADRKQIIDITQIISMIDSPRYGLAFVNDESPAAAYAQPNLQFIFCDTNVENTTIVHELIHIISNNLIAQKAKCFNEVLTEFFAKIINAQMSEENFFIGENKEFYSGYDDCVNLLSKFLIKNYQALTKSYMEDSLDPILLLIGEENLGELDAVCGDIFKISIDQLDLSYWKALNNNEELNFNASHQNLLDRLKNVMDKINQHMKTDSNSLE